MNELPPTTLHLDKEQEGMSLLGQLGCILMGPGVQATEA